MSERGATPTPPDRSLLPAVVAFVAALAAGVGFIWAYLADAGNQWLGGFAALGLVGLGYGVAYWGRTLHEPPARERYPLPGEDEPGREALAEELERSAAPLTRRRFVTAFLAGAAALFGVGLLFPIGSLGPLPDARLRRTSWRSGLRVVTADGDPIPRDALADGGFLVAFPEGHVGAADSQVVVIRPPADRLDLPPGRESWTPGGFLAYSRVCTHAGCPVAQYQDDEHLLVCPCHQSVFDALAGAVPLSGPAGRPLPQLPLAIDDAGYLIAQGDFEAPVGPGYWDLP